MSNTDQTDVMRLTLGLLEETRREGRYEQMSKLADSIERTLGDLDEPKANKIRSRMKYELGMAAYQQGAAATSAGERRECFLKSRRLNRESAIVAEVAGDTAGVLNARMNDTGLLAPILDIGTPWRDILEASEKVSDEAVMFAADAATSEKDRRRALRVAVNCYFHQWRILRGNGGDRSEVAALMEKIEANPVYADPDDSSYRDAVREQVEEIRRYLAQ